MSRAEKFLKFVEVLENGTILDKEGKELKQYIGKRLLLYNAARSWIYSSASIGSS